MITKEKKVEKICSFYASDYHLEMIMIPYINKKIENNSKIIIMTQKDLKETAETVISKINLPEDRKKEILSIDWESNDPEKIKEIKNTNNAQEIVIFVIGNLNYIKNINNSIYEYIKNYNAKVVDCYSLEDSQEKMIEIVSEHTKVLNTAQEKDLS